MALPRGAKGLTAVCDFVFPDHTHLLFLRLMVENVNYVISYEDEFHCFRMSPLW